MDKPIFDQIQDARLLAERTGLRVVKRVDKRRFLEEFPQAAADPRMALTPTQFEIEFASFEALSVGELRELCLRCKGHPLALQKALHVEGMPDRQVIYILKEEIQIMHAAAAGEVPKQLILDQV